NFATAGSGAFVSQDFNLSSDNSGIGFLTQPADINNSDPLLGPLGFHGGPTETYVPQFGSLAIDGGPAAGPPFFDQRGVMRPQGSAVDIGAVEVVPLEAPEAATIAAVDTASGP